MGWRDLVKEQKPHLPFLPYNDALDLAPLLPAPLEMLELRGVIGREKNVLVKTLRSKDRYLPKWSVLNATFGRNDATKDKPRIVKEIRASANDAGVRSNEQLSVDELTSI